jgi:hypothetical protein
VRPAAAFWLFEPHSRIRHRLSSSGLVEKKKVSEPCVVLVAGARQVDRQTLLSTFSALAWAELDRQAWQGVGLLAAELRDRGKCCRSPISRSPLPYRQPVRPCGHPIVTSSGWLRSSKGSSYAWSPPGA